MDKEMHALSFLDRVGRRCLVASLLGIVIAFGCRQQAPSGQPRNATTPIGGAGSSLPSAVKQKLPTLSGRITYKRTGPAEQGTITLTWMNHGQKLRQDQTMRGSYFANSKPTLWSRWTIYDGTQMHMYSSVDKKVTPMPAQGLSLQNVVGVMMGSSMPVEFKLAGKTALLGKPCEIRQRITDINPQMRIRNKVWLWKSLPLRIEMSTENPKTGKSLHKTPIVTVATKLDTNPKLSPSLFKVPIGLGS